MLGALAVRRPVGVVTCITSYNNPWANPAGKIAPALAMGNTVVVKPAPQDPLSVYRMAAALAEAGAPPGVVNVVSGASAEAGEAAVDSPDVDMVSFTGSTAVGQRIAEVCGRGMKRQLMELGGKGAAVVFDDADLDSAVAGIGTTYAFYSGQICTAPTRVIVQRGVYEALVERLTRYIGHLEVGDPRAPGTVVGPVISAAHRDRVESYVELGRKEGARVVAGGARPSVPERGFYVAPTLLADCTPDMRVVREEIFGPVVVVLPFDEEDEGGPRQRQRLRAHRLRVVRRYRPRLPGGRAAAGRRGRCEHGRPEHGSALRRLQTERGRAGRGLVRAACLQRVAGDGLAGVRAGRWAAPATVPAPPSTDGYRVRAL